MSWCTSILFIHPGCDSHAASLHNKQVMDIARDFDEIRVGALANADNEGKWPKNCDPFCCFSLTSGEGKGSKTW